MRNKLPHTANISNQTTWTRTSSMANRQSARLHPKGAFFTKWNFDYMLACCDLDLWPHYRIFLSLCPTAHSVVLGNYNGGWLLHTRILSCGGYAFFQVHKILNWTYLTFGYGRGCALGRKWWTASALDIVHPEGKEERKKSSERNSKYSIYC